MGRKAYIESLLRPYFFHEKHRRYAQQRADVRDRLAIHEALLQAHMAPHGLHHAQRERVKLAVDLDRGKHVVEAPAERLHPAHVGLVALEARDHVLCAGQLLVRPLEPTPHHRVFRHVHAFHWAERLAVFCT